MKVSLAKCLTMRMRSVRLLALMSALSIMSGSLPGWAADLPCANPDALGVSRTQEIDTSVGPIFGDIQYTHAPVFLHDKEVVLTFDDGPNTETTPAILEALAEQCTKATFFYVGRMALKNPDILAQVDAAGMTIGAHTWSHADLRKLPGSLAQVEIERGVSLLETRLGHPIAPFFRFPYLSAPSSVAHYLGGRQFAVFSADVDSWDSHGLTPSAHIVNYVMSRLKEQGHGIVLMHDIKHTTAAALPEILRQLKEGGWKIVNLVPKAPAASLAPYNTWARDTIEKNDASVAVAANDPIPPDPTLPEPSKSAPATAAASKKHSVTVAANGETANLTAASLVVSAGSSRRAAVRHETFAPAVLFVPLPSDNQVTPVSAVRLQPASDPGEPSQAVTAPLAGTPIAPARRILAAATPDATLPPEARSITLAGLLHGTAEVPTAVEQATPSVAAIRLASTEPFAPALRLPPGSLALDKPGAMPHTLDPSLEKAANVVVPAPAEPPSPSAKAVATAGLVTPPGDAALLPSRQKVLRVAAASVGTSAPLPASNLAPAVRLAAAVSAAPMAAHSRPVVAAQTPPRSNLAVPADPFDAGTVSVASAAAAAPSAIVAPAESGAKRLALANIDALAPLPPLHGAPPAADSGKISQTMVPVTSLDPSQVEAATPAMSEKEVKLAMRAKAEAAAMAARILRKRQIAAASAAAVTTVEIKIASATPFKPFDQSPPTDPLPPVPPALKPSVPAAQSAQHALVLANTNPGFEPAKLTKAVKVSADDGSGAPKKKPLKPLKLAKVPAEWLTPLDGVSNLFKLLPQ